MQIEKQGSGRDDCESISPDCIDAFLDRGELVVLLAAPRKLATLGRDARNDAMHDDARDGDNHRDGPPALPEEGVDRGECEGHRPEPPRRRLLLHRVLPHRPDGWDERPDNDSYDDGVGILETRVSPDQDADHSNTGHPELANARKSELANHENVNERADATD